MDIELEQIALLQAWYLHKSRTALPEGTSMPQYGLIGDSSLYTKSGKNVRRVDSQLLFLQLGTYPSHILAALHVQAGIADEAILRH